MMERNKANMIGIAQKLALHAKSMRANHPDSKERTSLYRPTLMKYLKEHSGEYTAWIVFEAATRRNCDDDGVNDVSFLDCLYQATLYHQDVLPLVKLQSTCSLAVLILAAAGKPTDSYNGLVILEHSSLLPRCKINNIDAEPQEKEGCCLRFDCVIL